MHTIDGVVYGINQLRVQNLVNLALKKGTRGSNGSGNSVKSCSTK